MLTPANPISSSIPWGATDNSCTRSSVLVSTKKRKIASDDQNNGNPKHLERLHNLEKAITEHLSTGKFFIVAAALRCIEEERLFYPERTVYSYAKSRFGFSRRTTNTYLCSSYVYESITEDKTLPIPVNISHVRSLHKYPPEVRRQIWKQLNDSGLTITEENVVAMTIKYETGVSFTELNNELYTPKAIIMAAKKVIEKKQFDLDPASCAFANTLHGDTIANTIYTEAEDGLQKIWNGHVWLSPPSGIDEAGLIRMKKWFLAAESKYLAGEIVSCHILLRVDMQNDWFLRALYYPHCFFHERIQFSTPTGREKLLTDSHMLVYMGTNTERFCIQFAQLGSIPGYSSWSFAPSKNKKTESESQHSTSDYLENKSTKELQQSHLASFSPNIVEMCPSNHMQPTFAHTACAAAAQNVSAAQTYNGHQFANTYQMNYSSQPAYSPQFHEFSTHQFSIPHATSNNQLGHMSMPIINPSTSLFLRYNHPVGDFSESVIPSVHQ
ncbi:hypothetical protein BATDEDRAFT_85509 [Batrachochytrium dendrobatidis JAM81]|uniref:Uncharacterized protein n=2 Tax=Batrachochytrium dendrobatidis TaxID=109871 RepID=F4NU07_BATDJ|nr:uncharacterized protein BATDEDRAFT_85509 [Batrachochytrium dendrobatidis JAM81]EGF83965.1 hypothetical protein BATDEDRAFT_85509 [Batrachochytrium dendrobatidis JAM81]KAJ8325818.1 hypothetical protein O5D80_006006 [Batrachochytrium dendrobatidis]KAK5671701.1 hypothetical protein QVD99_001540 [Batrachochytrium dendrobatidis]OAJ36300.1 hypothetical protein BDEG_20490 [Batrachochytrium dendrobatidis JEL423]|eukprot:XP_006676294.1 hypothetical protein BATDEDRAFT_85509 [Batrachochytrium dendrobatidis JAM81]